jgi:hypothetical protein
MARTSTPALRIEVVERHLAGESLPSIAAALQLNPSTVRGFWRLYRLHRCDGLVPLPSGPPHRGPLASAHPRIKSVLLRLKRQHRGWGVNKLRLELTRRPSLQRLVIPQRSALGSYLAQCGARLRRPRRAPTKRPHAPVAPPPTEPHQCWQIDFKRDEPVAGCAAGYIMPAACTIASAQRCRAGSVSSTNVARWRVSEATVSAAWTREVAVPTSTARSLTPSVVSLSDVS